MTVFYKPPFVLFEENTPPTGTSPFSASTSTRSNGTAGMNNKVQTAGKPNRATILPVPFKQAVLPDGLSSNKSSLRWHILCILAA